MTHLACVKLTNTRRFAAYGLIILLVCLMYGQSPSLSFSQRQASKSEVWQEFVSSQGRFRVLFPDIPKARTVPVIGNVVVSEMHAFVVETPVAGYMVSYADFPNASRDPRLLKNAFVTARESALADGTGQLVSEKVITAGNIPGRELEIERGADLLKDRMYFVKGRLYQLTFIMPRQRGMSDGLIKFYDNLFRKFFDSFKMSDASTAND